MLKVTIVFNGTGEGFFFASKYLWLLFLSCKFYYFFDAPLSGF